MTNNKVKAQTSGSATRFLLTGAVLFGVLVFYAWDYVDGLTFYRSVQAWPITVGTVTANKLEDPNAATPAPASPKMIEGEVSSIAYDYVVNEKMYSSNRVVLLQPRKYLQNWKMFYDNPDVKSLVAKYPVGAKVEVHYDPTNPAEASLDVETGWKSRYVAVCFTALLIVIPTLGFFLSSFLINLAENVTDKTTPKPSESST